MPQPNTSPPLHRLLGQTADAVAAVRAGRSLTEVLAACPADLRAGTQALSFAVLRALAGATAARALMAPKPPPPSSDITVGGSGSGNNCISCESTARGACSSNSLLSRIFISPSRRRNSRSAIPARTSLRPSAGPATTASLSSTISTSAL